MGYQQDACEFMKLFLSLLQDDGGMDLKVQIKETTRYTVGVLSSLMLFHFQFCTGKQTYVTECGTCHKKSPRTEDFIDLQLIIPPSSGKEKVTLQTCIDNYQTEEEMMGDNGYACGS